MGEVVRFQDARRRREEPVPIDPEGERSEPPPHELLAEEATLAAMILDSRPHADGSPRIVALRSRGYLYAV